jgi:hypothetical protein
MLRVGWKKPTLGEVHLFAETLALVAMLTPSNRAAKSRQKARARFRSLAAAYQARGSANARATASAAWGRPSFFCGWWIGLAECGSRTALPPASLRSRRGGQPRSALGAREGRGETPQKS